MCRGRRGAVEGTILAGPAGHPVQPWLALSLTGGVNVMCFTTGRGGVFGCEPAPSLKLTTNTAMFTRMKVDMDINCGTGAKAFSRAGHGSSGICWRPQWRAHDE